MQMLANPFVSSIATALVSSLWQGLAIAFVLSICLKLAPRVSAALRFAAWAAGFVAAASLPVLPFLAHFASRAHSEIATTGLHRAAAAPLLQLDLRWSTVIVGLWAAAVLFRAVDLGMHSLRLRSLWKAATPIETSEALAANLASLGRGQVQICTTSMLNRPSVIGFFAPRILIPDWLLEKLSAAEFEQIVLHEAQHLRRRDDWTNLLQKLLMVVFPLNPALWWLERNLCREREMACDEGVVRVTHAPRAYAACLASLAERGLHHRAEALSLGAWQQRSELVDRVHGILLRRQTLRPAASAMLLVALGCGIVAGSVELARSPQLVAFVPAQKPGSAVASVSVQGDAVFTDKRNLAPGFHVVEAKAMIPAARRVSRVFGNTQPKSSVSKLAALPAQKVSAWKNDSTAVAKSTRPHSLKQVDEQEQFIVFTSVEQIGTEASAVARNGQVIADFDSDAGGDSVVRYPANGGAPSGQVRNQITVTRLILRILPPTPFPVQPDPASFHNGWFVIQL